MIKKMLFATLVLSVAFPAAAQNWPAKPVRMLITFPPGGPSEILTRLVNERLQAALKQPFVVENRAGAGGNIGTDAVAKAAPDEIGRASCRERVESSVGGVS